MSARWQVWLICDKCGRASIGTVVDRARYGEKLQALRSEVARHGWTSRRGVGSGRPVRDYCKTCSRERP